MSFLEKKASSFSIVLIGDFSPSMFQPYWFKHYGIISDDEFNSIRRNEEKTIITNSFSTFETENLCFRIELKRFTIIAKKEPFELLLDVLKKFQETTSSLLIKKFGMNYSFHIDLENLQNMNMFGDIIAPKKYWKSFFYDVDVNNRENGLANISMVKKTEFGYTNLIIETSSYFTNALYVTYNFHFDSPSDNSFDFLDVADLIDEKYNQFMNYSNDTTKKIIEGVFNNERK